jgi:hypothetical protein
MGPVVGAQFGEKFFMYALSVFSDIEPAVGTAGGVRHPLKIDHSL